MPFDNMIGDLRDELENAVRTLSTSPWIPSLFDHDGIRVPLCEVVDKGDLGEIIPRKVKSKIKNGIFFVQLPKRNPEKSSKAKVIG